MSAKTTTKAMKKLTGSDVPSPKRLSIGPTGSSFSGAMRLCTRLVKVSATFAVRES